jgi:DNA primase
MAGRIPKQFIDDLLLRVDIVDVIDGRVPLKKAGKDYKACCPFHDEKSASFTVSPTKQFYHCFGCGAHGTAIGFLMEYEHMSFPEAVEELAGRVGLDIPKDAQAPAGRSDNAADLLPVLEEAAKYYRSQLRDAPRAVDYLKRRGISGEIAAQFGLGYAPDSWDRLTETLGTSAERREALIQAGLAVRKDTGGCYDRFRDRVMFPIHDYRGRIIGFGGRIIDKGEPKYLNSPETPLFHKGRELYGLFKARDSIRRGRRVLVVEGYMDVVGLAQHGVDIAVATLGTATTKDHLERLFRFDNPEVVFCFDGDRAGRDAAWRALDVVLPLLHERRLASFLFLPEGEDPDTLVRQEGKDKFLERVRAATSLPDFLSKGLADQVDMSRNTAGVQLAELARPYLSKVPAGILRSVILDRLNISPVIRGELDSLADRPAGAAAVGMRPGVTRAGGPQSPPSTVRVAAALLVQHPEVIAEIKDREFLRVLDLPGMPVFNAIIDAVQAQPGLNTAALVEQFRDSEHQHHVARLAVWAHPTLGHDNVASEFRGVLIQMRRAAIKAKLENLLQKQKIYGLTATEKTELVRLLAENAAPPAP